MKGRATVVAVAVAVLTGVAGVHIAHALVPKSYPSYLAQARPVLVQWHNAIEGHLGFNFLVEPTDSNTENAAEVEALLDQWYPGLENARGTHFLVEPTATNLDTTLELHSLLNQWQNAIEAWFGSHYLLEPPGPYLSFIQKSVGKGKLKPKHSDLQPGQRTELATDWTVPDPSNWHDLETIELRVCGGAKGVLLVRWEELTNKVSLLDPKTGRKLASGTLGDNKRLSSPAAKLFLRSSAATADGPAARKVTLRLDLSFKSSASGIDCEVEFAASDDLGNSDKFKRAGTLTIAG